MTEKLSGSAQFKDFDAYLAWYSGLVSLDSMDAAYKMLWDYATPYRNTHRANDVDRTIEKMFHPSGGYGGGIRTKQDAWDETREQYISIIRRFYQFSTVYEQPVKVGVWLDGNCAFLHLGNPQKGIIVPTPEQYLEYIPDEDLSNITPAELRARLSIPAGADGQTMVPADQQGILTKATLGSQLEQQKSEIERLLLQQDDVRNARSGELAAIQAQIDALTSSLEEKKSALMEQLNAKMAEMEKMKEALENQIYLLDSQLYAIRCYAGEVVNFAHIRKGKNAPNTEPIVIYQKLRFLDEDLGRIASLYELQWDQLGMFESFLQHHPLALDTFAPNERCVMLVRLSRTAKTYGAKTSQDTPYSNMLEEYDYYHGKTVGIIIRNGENVYLGWTDEDRVHINDDLILSRIVTDITPGKPEELASEFERQQREKEWKAEQKRLLDGVISRAFVYNILQGIVDNSSLLPLPVGVKLNKQSQYVIYSVADKSLTDNRFGSFTDIVALCNSRVNEGDCLLTVQFLMSERDRSLFGSRWVPDTWSNPRGRGDRNRTRDCSVDDCKLYKANLVEYDEPVDFIRYQYVSGKNPDGSPHYSGPYITRDDGTLSKDVEIISRFTERRRHVYVSVPKTGSRCRGIESRSNFEVRNAEFINLTYMNSVWLEWVITNNKLGGWMIGGKAVDYAYAIRYLKVAMDHIRRREELEKSLIEEIDPNICKDSDWPLKLTQWKLDKNVRAMSSYQAKRFVKAYPSLNGKIDLTQIPESVD